MENETLVAENVEIDMETLRIARSLLVSRIVRHVALTCIADAVENALSPADRKRLEEYREQ